MTCCPFLLKNTPHFLFVFLMSLHKILIPTLQKFQSCLHPLSVNHEMLLGLIAQIPIDRIDYIYSNIVLKIANFLMIFREMFPNRDEKQRDKNTKRKSMRSLGVQEPSLSQLLTHWLNVPAFHFIILIISCMESNTQNWIFKLFITCLTHRVSYIIWEWSFLSNGVDRRWCVSNYNNIIYLRCYIILLQIPKVPVQSYSFNQVYCCIWELKC